VSLADHILFVMSPKLAQRRGSWDIAAQLGQPASVVQRELWNLERRHLVHRAQDGHWMLTRSGNMHRNRLTSAH
jgi:Mn-dependent DtxR family transcriptional regulator